MEKIDSESSVVCHPTENTKIIDSESSVASRRTGNTKIIDAKSSAASHPTEKTKVIDAASSAASHPTETTKIIDAESSAVSHPTEDTKELDLKKLIEIRRANPGVEKEQLDFLCFASLVPDQTTFDTSDDPKITDKRPSRKQLKKNNKRNRQFAAQVGDVNRKKMLNLLQYLKRIPSTLQLGTFVNHVFTVNETSQVEAAIILQELKEWKAGQLVVGGNVNPAVYGDMAAMCYKFNIKIVSA